MIAGLALNLPLELRYVIGRLRGRSAAESISVEDAMALVAGDRPVLDVRKPEEWASGHIPLGQLSGRLAEVPDELILTISRSGNRSEVAADLLAKRGLQARSVAGGMDPCRAKMYRLRRTGRHSR